MGETTRANIIGDFKNKYMKFLDVLKELSEKRFSNPTQDMTMEVWRFHKMVVTPMEEAWAKLNDEEKDKFINFIFKKEEK